MDPKLRYVTALILSITSSFLTALSLILLKISNIKILNRKSKILWYTAYIQPFGFIGILILILGLVLNTIAIQKASIILLASTPCFTLIFNSLLVPCILGDDISIISEIIATFLLLAGSFICIMNSKETHKIF